MGARKHKGKKSQISKVSIAKLSNKRLNKLAKQGRLKKAVPKKKLVEFLQRRVNHTVVPESKEKVPDPDDIPLQEDDFEYFSKPGRDFSFLLGSREQHKSEKKRKKMEDDYENVEGFYEKRLKTAPEKEVEVKELLPFKSKENGIIHRTMEVEIPPEEEEQEAAACYNESEELSPLTPLEEIIQEELKKKETKNHLKQCVSALLESPEENVQKLKELCSFLNINDQNIPLNIRKFAIISLLRVYKDIIPGYRIRILTEEEKKQKMKKETKAIHAYEQALLANYCQFVKSLEVLATGKQSSTKENSKRKNQVAIIQVPKGLKFLSVKSLCELLATHPHFNMRKEVMAIMLRFMTSGNSELSDLVCETVKQIFAKDKCGDVSLEIVRLIGRIIKVKHFEVKPKVLDTFLSLKIKEVEKPEDKEAEKKLTRDERLKKFSKRERKRQKTMVFLEKELRDAAAEGDVKLKLKLNTEIMNTIFLTYFRILKQTKKSGILTSVLEGIGKFAHLINVAFFDDLFAAMTELVSGEEVSTRCSLQCVHTAMTLLMGQGEAFNIDPVKFYNHLYKTLLELNAGGEVDNLGIALKCIDILISKRRRHLSEQRVFAFLKRLCIVALQMPAKGTLAILETVQKITMEFPKSEVMFSDERFGSGIYLPELPEPDNCNASNSALFELHLLRRSSDSRVRSCANHILKGTKKYGNFQ